MPEESAVMDAEVATNGQTTEETPSELADFHWEEYKQYFPEPCANVLTAMFSQQKYGWIKRAKIVKKIANADAHRQALSQTLIELCSERKARAQAIIAPNAGLRAWLVSRSDDVLKSLCEQYSVSYASFSHDRSTLVEALLDEMMATE